MTTTNKSPLHDLISFVMQLTPEQLAAINRLTKDPMDTLRVIVDFAAFRRFLGEWSTAEKLGVSPSPKAPPLTSRYLRRTLSAAADEIDVAAKWIAREARAYLAADALTVAK